MNGRVEIENKIQKKIEDKIRNLPQIFDAFYNYLESDGKSYGTCERYIDYVYGFMKYITKGEYIEEFYKNATVTEVRTYISSLRRRTEKGAEIKNGDSIQASRWSALNTFYNFLVLDDYVETNPMAKTKRPKDKSNKEVVYLEKDEINQILDKIKEDNNNKFLNRDLAIVILGISTGLRVGALVQINVEDIDFKTNTIKVWEKGGKERSIKFGNNTRAILSQWIKDRETYFDGLETNALFISQWRDRITTEGLRKVLRKYTKDLDKHITPHSLRKSCATQAYIAGTDIRTIANMLGHNSTSTTLKYAAAVDSKKDEMVDNLDKLF
jgi:integrase/recombinase XerC